MSGLVSNQPMESLIITNLFLFIKLLILSFLSGGYLSGFKTKSKQLSDVESVKTEEFEDRFREIMEQKAAGK